MIPVSEVHLPGIDKKAVALLQQNSPSVDRIIHCAREHMDKLQIVMPMAVCPHIRVGGQFPTAYVQTDTRLVVREINEHDMEYYYKDRKIDPDDLAEEQALREDPDVRKAK